jgi:hypothetical protein
VTSVETVTLESLREALHELGFRAAILSDGSGASFVRSATSGMGFDVRLGSPAAGRDGEALDFRLVAAVEVEGAFDLDLINGWNNGRRFSRLHLDQGLLLLDMDVSVAGGVAPGFLRAQLETWSRLVTDWVDQLRRGFARRAEGLAPSPAEERFQNIA